MKTVLTALVLFSICSANTIAQDPNLGGLPEGAKARLRKGYIYDLKYAPYGSRLAAASSKGVWLYDSVTGDTVTLTRDGKRFKARGVAFSADGRTLFAADRGSICVWDAETGDQKRSLHLHKFLYRRFSRVAFSPDGQTLAAGLDDIVRLWDTATGELESSLAGGRFGNVWSLALSPDGRTLATGQKSLDVGHSERDGIVRLWDTATGDLQGTSSVGIRRPTSLAFSPDGRTLAVGHLDSGFGSGARGWVSLLDAETLEFKRDLGRHPRGAGLEYGVECVAFSADGGTLAIGRSIDDWWGFVYGTLRLWNVNTGENIRVLEGHTDDVTNVAFSADGRTLASASRDGTLLLWDIAVDADIPAIKGDINQDGVVNIQDLVLVAGRLGKSGENREDVNGDGIVNILDLVLVAGMLDNAAGAPLIDLGGTEMLRTTRVREWLAEVRRLDLADPAIPRGIEYLERLLEALTPERTALLPNYPNPFNPETWIPYQLARESEVRISMYNAKGILVRHLDVGLQPEGFYTDRHYAAYWDGRNDTGELLASGVYIYVFRAGSYRASRRMAIVR